MPGKGGFFLFIINEQHGIYGQFINRSYQAFPQCRLHKQDFAHFLDAGKAKI